MRKGAKQCDVKSTPGVGRSALLCQKVSSSSMEGADVRKLRDMVRCSAEWYRRTQGVRRRITLAWMRYTVQWRTA